MSSGLNPPQGIVPKRRRQLWSDPLIAYDRPARVVVIARTALKELNSKLSHTDVEIVRQIVAERALQGTFADKSVPLMHIKIPASRISRPVVVQYFIQVRSSLRRPSCYVVCIVAIDPQDTELFPSPLSSVADAGKEVKPGPTIVDSVKARCIAILDEIQKQGVILGAHDLLNWIIRGLGG